MKPMAKIHSLFRGRLVLVLGLRPFGSWVALIFGTKMADITFDTLHL
jgi:hypothetical protein